jgi:hypothetical protein
MINNNFSASVAQCAHSRSTERNPEPTRKKTPPPISLRLTDKERTILENAAQGMSISAYIRSCIFSDGAAKRKARTRRPVKDQEALARALGLLGQSRIANNLNQLARHANSGSLAVDDETRAQIEEAYAHVMALRDQLIAALGLIEERSQ